MPQAPIPVRHWWTPEDCRVSDLHELVSQGTTLEDYPHAAAVESDVLIYDSAHLRTKLDDEATRRSVMAELARALDSGPGVIVLRSAFANASVVDAATAGFNRIGAAERAQGAAQGDHFAAAGSNMRIWNALEKLATDDPDAFVAYYSNEVLALVCEAWLGPGYQVTSQVNQVNPGGKAQVPHRDYHLGFQSKESAAAYPVHVHALSSVLTLQGAIAHCDMPVESGPTLLLPHSQRYAPGYVAWHLPEFIDYFATAHVQLPLVKGDAMFLNPALHHAAGENRSEGILRMANLLQVSSPFGRAMETVDRHRMCLATFPALMRARRAGLRDAQLGAAIAAIAEAYAFPTNLDRDSPRGSEAPPAQAAILRQAVDEEWDTVTLEGQLAAYDERRRSW